MPQIDWSQFIPELIIAVFTVFLGRFLYIKSDKFKKWFNRLVNKMVKWFVTNWHFFILHSILIILGAIVFTTYCDWKILTFAIICYLAGMFSWKFAGSRLILFSKSTITKSKKRFLPLSIKSGLGNSYLKSRYIGPPFGDDPLGNAQFRLEEDSLIFDTSKDIRYNLLLKDGGKGIDFKLPEPQNQIKSVNFLINSGNSKRGYEHKCIGEIRLIFRDAPPIIVELVLGKNIREWCPGNPGDFVREATDPMITMDVWKGLSHSGAHAVMDCLNIPVYECMRNCILEKLIFVHKTLQLPEDTMGVHYSIFAISLELEQ